MLVLIYLENNFQNIKIIAPHLFNVIRLILSTVVDRTQLRLKERRIYLLREQKSSEISANFRNRLEFKHVIEYLYLSRINQWFTLATFILKQISALCWKVANGSSTLTFFQLKSFSGKYGYPFLITQKHSQDWVLVGHLGSPLITSAKYSRMPQNWMIASSPPNPHGLRVKW